MLAAVACGEYASVEEAAAKIVEVVDTIEPDPELTAKYEERYSKFVKIYPTVKDLFSQIPVRNPKTCPRAAWQLRGFLDKNKRSVQMIKLCVFDLDGTLADTIDSMAYPANRALKELGLPELPYEGFRYYAGDGAAMLCKRALAAAGDRKVCTMKYFILSTGNISA